MKYEFFIILLTFAFASNSSYAQLVIDAGTDTSYCYNPNNEVVFGGNPTAEGGTEPYTYNWTLIETSYYNHELELSDILSDTSISNPEIIYLPFDFNDSMLIELQVVDGNHASKKDTIKVVASSLLLRHLVLYSPTINPGDSIQLGPVNLVNGIAPFNYIWSPSYKLSNPAARDPFASPDTTTTYTLTIKDAIGCIASEEIKVIVKYTSSYSHTHRKLIKSITYPNPINNSSIIRFGFLQDRIKCIEIYNSQGQLIILDKFDAPHYSVGNIKDAGSYYYILKVNNIIVSNGQFQKF